MHIDSPWVVTLLRSMTLLVVIPRIMAKNRMRCLHLRMTGLMYVTSVEAAARTHSTTVLTSTEGAFPSNFIRKVNFSHFVTN